MQYELHLPPSTGDLDLREEDPIVSSCVWCSKSLKVYEVTVMYNGEHCCLSVDCQDSYRHFIEKGELI